MDRYEVKEKRDSNAYDAYSAEYITAFCNLFHPIQSYHYPSINAHIPSWKEQKTPAERSLQASQNAARFLFNFRQVYSQNFDILRNLPRYRYFSRIYSDRKLHSGTCVGRKEYLELNRRRPSVIRRSIRSNSTRSPAREAVLEPSFSYAGNDRDTVQENNKVIHGDPQAVQPISSTINKNPQSKSYLSTDINKDQQSEHNLSTAIQKDAQCTNCMYQVIHKDPQLENNLSQVIHKDPQSNHLSTTIHKDPLYENHLSNTVCINLQPEPPLSSDTHEVSKLNSNLPKFIHKNPQHEQVKSPIAPKKRYLATQSAQNELQMDEVIHKGQQKSPEPAQAISDDPNIPPLSPAILEQQHLPTETSSDKHEHNDLTNSMDKTKNSDCRTSAGKLETVKRGKQTKFHCFYCKKSFCWFSHWKAHERIHTGERPYKCSLCDRCFARGDGLQAHMVIHGTKKAHKCITCEKKFGRKAMLDRHIVEHTGVLPFNCDVCSVEIVDVKDIEAHLAKHNGQDIKSKCPYCCRSFINGQRLVRHIRNHTGEKPFPCSQCKMRFNKKSALAIHHRVHSGAKPFRCSDCGKSFSIVGNLRRHSLIHTGERPYACTTCKKTFNNKSHLARHISTQHS